MMTNECELLFLTPVIFFGFFKHCVVSKSHPLICYRLEFTPIVLDLFFISTLCTTTYHINLSPSAGFL